MTQALQFEVRRDDLTTSRVVEQALQALNTGQVLARVDRFALTANNITYAVVGEKFGYWNFFPAAEGWGVIPVWGFAEVIESRHAEVPAGERLYGFFPMGTHLVLTPARVSAQRLVEGSPHRTALPTLYNQYSRVRAEPHYDPALDDERMLLYPLYATAYCLYDYLADNDWFGAGQITLVSASSKTAIGLALALTEDSSGPRAIALTSRGNLTMVRRLGIYAQSLSYAEILSIDATIPTVIVDFSGNGGILSALHQHLGDNMRFCSNVGVTHSEESHMGPHFIAERSALFFAPSHIRKRAGEWGAGVFEEKAHAFWQRGALQSRAWLAFDHEHGIAGLEAAYRRVREGKAPPDRGVIVDLSSMR